MDTSMYDRQIQAYQNDKELEVKKQIAKATAGGKTPAAMQLAQEYQRARASGNIEYANQLAQFAKIWDKGFQTNADGTMGGMQGYGPTLQSMEDYKQTGKNASDLRFANPTKRAERLGTLEADQMGAQNDKGMKARNMQEPMSRAEALLLSGNPSGSYPGMLWGKGKQAFGVSDDQTKSDTELELLSGWLTANVPRMEGPQSNFDVENYKTMAGKVGDRTLPREDRIAALRGLQSLQEKYANSAPGWPSDPSRPPAPPSGMAPVFGDIEQPPAMPAPDAPPVQGAGNDMPEGSKLIGTSKGKKVYQLPDGSYVMEQ